MKNILILLFLVFFLSGCFTDKDEIPSGYYVYTPSAFTPNNDGLNDFWMPLFSFTNFPEPVIYWKVMSQDGISLFETDIIGSRWDGFYNEKKMPPGAYLFYIRLEFEDEPKYEESGILSLAG